MNRIVKSLRTFILAVLSLTVCAAFADYPTKPVTMIVPYGPGGAADLAARTLGNAVPESLGENLLVVNKTGAAGVTGSTFAAKSRPDGYNLLMARVGSQAAVPAINKKIPYKWDEFTFIGLLEQNPFVLVINPDLGYTSLEDLKKAVEGGEKLSYASAGVGTLLHLAMIMLLDNLGLDQDAMKHIPYKGGGKAAAAVVGGHVDMLFQNLSGVIGNIESGNLTPIAVTTKDRQPSIPDVATVAEQGYPELETVIGWSGVWGPPNLPEEVTTKWASVMEALKTDQAWNDKTKELGSIPSIMSPEDTKAFVQAQYEAFNAITEKLDMQIN